MEDLLEFGALAEPLQIGVFPGEFRVGRIFEVAVVGRRLEP
jgi:hypothetical protein